MEIGIRLVVDGRNDVGMLMAQITDCDPGYKIVMRSLVLIVQEYTTRFLYAEGKWIRAGLGNVTEKQLVIAGHLFLSKVKIIS